MKPKFTNLLLSASIVVSFSSQAFAAPVVKQNNTVNLNDNGSWVGGTTQPGSADIAVWDATVNVNQTVALGADLSWGGIDMTNSGGDVTINGANILTIGASGITSAASKWVWIDSAVTLGAAQTWTTPNNLFARGIVSGGFELTKAGGAILTLTNANTLSGGVKVTGGQLTAKNGAALGANTLTLGNGTTYRYERTTANASTFQGNAITVSPSSSVTITTDNSGNGYSGVISGDANSTVTIGATGATTQCSFSAGSSTQQFGSFMGRVEIFDGTSLRFSSTSSLNNGGASAIWDTNTSGEIAARNTGTVNLGALVGNGSIVGSSGADNNTTTFSVGALGSNSTFDGIIRDSNTAVGRRAALTKVGAGTLTLTSATGLTYTGATNVNEGTLKINGTKSGIGTTTVKINTTLTGAGSVAGTTTIQSGGTLAPGDGGVGNITHSSLTLASGSILDIEFGSGNDTATVSSGGTLTLTSGATVDVNGFGTDGTYTIINTTGASVSGTAATALTAVGGNGLKVYTFGYTGTAITMTITSSDPSNYWNVNGTGTWELAGNWTKNEIPDAIGAIAKVGPGVGGILANAFSDLTFSITLDADQKVGTLAFSDTVGTSVVIDPGLTTPGSLLFDNGASASILAGVAGVHVINAPVVVDADDLTVDVGDDALPETPTYLLTLNGVVSGSGAAIVKSGLGILALMGANTFDGGTTLGAGSVRIGTLTSLGATSTAATFTGGTLQLGAALTGVTRSLLVSGASNAIIDTNGFAYGYDGVIAPLGGGTGGLNKIGGGTLTLTAAQTYTGATNVTGGTLTVAGGSITSGATSSVTSAGLTVSSGSVAFNAGLNGNSANPASAMSISLTGGTFSASYVTIGRCTSNTNVIYNPIAGRTESGLYINGATASITGALNVGQGSSTNSTSSARIDSGSLSVGGAVVIQVNSPDRWSVLDVNGGSFTSTNVATGVQIGSGQTGSDALIVRNTGVATVEKIQLIQPVASTETSLLNVLGGTLYVGFGGIIGNNNGGTGVLDVQLGTATLGAKATWSTLLGATLNGTTVIKAANAVDAAFNISIAGVVGGTGGLQKTGTGTLTLSGANVYQGTTLVSAGNLAFTGDSSGALGAVTVATGATLSGSGNIGGSVTIDSTGHHALAVADVVANQVTRVITGALTMTSGNILDLSAAVTPSPGTYVLITATGGITGTIPNTTVNYNGITGTVAINGNNVELTVSGAAGYSSWASLNGASANANEDHDNDGVSNGVEYFIGGPNGNTTGFTPLPGVITVNGVLSVTWTHAASYTGTYGTDYVIQTSTTLAAGSWTNETLGGNVVTSGNTVTYTFPAGPVKNFARLVVTP